MGSKIKRYHVEKHAVEYTDLVENTIQIAIPIHLLAGQLSIPIDSTGIKNIVGHFKLTSEMVKHLKEAYLTSTADAPSATDATVHVELYNVTDGSVVAYVEYAGEGGTKVSSDIASTLKTLAGKWFNARLNVTTASATTGATQVFRSIVLRLVLGIS